MKRKIILLLIVAVATVSVIPINQVKADMDYPVVCGGSNGPYCYYYSFFDNAWLPYASPTLSPCARLRVCAT